MSAITRRTLSSALSRSYATRRENRTYPTRERKRLWWIVSTMHYVWRGSNLNSSPLNRIETHRRHRASAPIAVSSTVTLTATVQQLIDGSPCGIAERLRQVICPPPPHPLPAAIADISLPSQTPSSATAEREGTYGQPAARANRNGRDGQAKSPETRRVLEMGRDQC